MRTACLILLCFAADPLLATEARGIPQIVDADTVYVGADKVRLIGIDAPETDQVCLDGKGQTVSCGLEAKNCLQEFSRGRPWICTFLRTDRYGRHLGTCTVDGEDVSRWLVRNGWALAFRQYSIAYVADEGSAREQGVGLWNGAFIAPWDWRRRNSKTVILGALEVSIDAQRSLVSSALVGASPTPGCVIKGNLSGRDQCVYHLPGGRFYDRLQMQPVAARRWFCSEAEAEAAGCRKSKL